MVDLKAKQTKLCTPTINGVKIVYRGNQSVSLINILQSQVVSIVIVEIVIEKEPVRTRRLKWEREIIGRLAENGRREIILRKMHIVQ